MCWGTDFREFLGRAKQHDNPDFVLRLGCRWPKRARWVCGCVRACVGVRVCARVLVCACACWYTWEKSLEGKEPLEKEPLEASLSSLGL